MSDTTHKDAMDAGWEKWQVTMGMLAYGRWAKELSGLTKLSPTPHEMEQAVAMFAAERDAAAPAQRQWYNIVKFAERISGLINLIRAPLFDDNGNPTDKLERMTRP